jgi:hypothetical protein
MALRGEACRHGNAYRMESNDINGRRLIVTGRHISGAREPRDIDGGALVPDMISGPVSDEARLLLASAGDGMASADNTATDLITVIAFIRAPTSSSFAARQPCRWVDIR